jgi:hypothetical protein
MLHLRVGLVLTALGLMVACGDDDDGPGDSTNTSDAAVGAAPGSGKAGSGGVMLRDAGMSAVSAGAGGGSVMTGTIEEGNPCNLANPCAPGLACVTTSIEGLSVCGRPCGQTGDAATACEADEACGSYTTLAKDRHCVNLVDTAYDPCGIFETADCAEPLACATLRDDPNTPEVEVISYCVLPCTSTSDADAGVDEFEMSTCPNGEVCLPNGICATLVERGGECRFGFFCEGETDLCLPDRTSDFANANYRCQQDCSEPGTACEVGECVTASDSSGAMASWCLDEN